MSDKFRYQLRQEAQKWQAEGLIDSQIYMEIAQRYQFAELEDNARNRFVMTLLGLGGVLLGLGVITLVAANWQLWSRSLRVIFLVSLFISSNTAGFYLWKSQRQGWQSFLGQTLLLFGALVLGANLGLMSQMFHLSGAVYQLYFVWGLGVLAMAYSLRMTSLGIFTTILLGIGYSLGIPELFRPGELSGLQLVIQQMPLLAVISLVPLAYWCSSRWIFGLGWILAVFSLEVNLVRQIFKFADISTLVVAVTAVMACTLVPALLWVYRGSLWKQNQAFDGIAQGLALAFLSILFYWLSFNFVWGDLETVITQLVWWDLLTFVDASIFAVFTVFAWIRFGKQGESRYWQISLSSTLVAASLIITGVLVWWHFVISEISVVAILGFNLLLFLLGLSLLRNAINLGRRSTFWNGIALLVLQLFTRMLEYNTGLVFKAVVLFICGVAIIIGGVWFERNKKV